MCIRDSLKACAKEYDSNVVLREYTINQQKDDILKDIYRCHPDVICISCYIWNITFVDVYKRQVLWRISVVSPPG